MRRGRATGAAWAALMFGCAPFFAAYAQGLAVAPVRLDVARGARAEVLTVTSHGDEPADVQVRVLRWTQDDSDDRLQPTDDVTVSPSRFALPGRAEQVVRVYRRNEADGERSYRVVIDQLPTGEAPAGTVRLPLRLVIPLFVEGRNADGHADLDWQARRGSDTLTLRLHNRGERHLRISRLAFAGDGGAQDSHDVLVYLLPGARREVRLPRPSWLTSAATSVHVLGDSDAGALDARLDLVGDP